MDDKFKTFGFVLLIALIGYNLYTGATVQKIGIPGIFEIEFGQNHPNQPTESQPPDVGSSSSEAEEPVSPPPAEKRSISGNWSGSIGSLELIVTKVEVVRQIGDKDMLRFYVTANNQTTDSISLPLFGYFVAVDDSGHSYEADPQLSNWPMNFPSGSSISGSIDLKDPVSQTASSIDISFTTIFGSLDIGGRSITVSGISTP